MKSLVLASVLFAGGALANGAFPDSFAIFAPADQLKRLILATNFGLLVSEDNGGTWYYVCEQAMGGLNQFLYEVGPPPLDQIGTISPASGLLLSDDDACTWTAAQGGVKTGFIEDFFFDPATPGHILAAVSRPNGPDGGRQPSVIFEATDGGTTFSNTPWYTSPAGQNILGLEIARSSPATAYLTLYQSATQTPFLTRTDDAGGAWSTFDLSGTIGAKSARIAAVDPVDPSRVYLRAISTCGGACEQDALLVATDGGAALAVPLSLGGAMSGFLRRANGDILVTTPDAGSFRSQDNGQTFTPWLSNLHLRALAERNGTLYLVGDDFLDGFAVASSAGDGTVRTTLLSFQKICGLDSCGNIPAACQSSWAALQKQLNIPDNACNPPRHSDCGCEARSGPSSIGLAMALCLAFAARRRRVGHSSTWH